MKVERQRDLAPGTRVTVTTERAPNYGAFALECWSATEGRKTARVWFADPDEFRLAVGMTGTIQDHSTEDPDWYVVAFGDYVVPMHRDDFTEEEGE